MEQENHSLEDDEFRHKWGLIEEAMVGANMRDRIPLPVRNVMGHSRCAMCLHYMRMNPSAVQREILRTQVKSQLNFPPEGI